MDISKLDLDSQINFLTQLSLKDLIKLESSSKKIRNILKNVYSYLIFDKIIYKNFDQLVFLSKYKIKVNSLYLNYNLAVNYNYDGTLDIKYYKFWVNLYRIIDDLMIDKFIFKSSGKKYEIKTIKSRLQKLSKEELILDVYDEKDLLQITEPQDLILRLFNYDEKLLNISKKKFNKIILTKIPKKITENLYFEIYLYNYEDQSEKEKIKFYKILNSEKINLISLFIDNESFLLLKKNRINDVFLKFDLNTLGLNNINLDVENINIIFRSDIKKLYLNDVLIKDSILKKIVKKVPNITSLTITCDDIDFKELKYIKKFDRLESLGLFITSRFYFQEVLELLKYLGKNKLQKISLYADEFLDKEKYIHFSLDKEGFMYDEFFEIINYQYKDIPEYWILKNYVDDVIFDFLESGVSIGENILGNFL